MPIGPTKATCCPLRRCGPGSAPRTADVTVIIVSYRVKDLLDRCLASIEASHGELNLQVLVVDNGSGDGTVKWIQERYPWIAVISNACNEGFSRANNQGLGRAEGRYILLLNPDTMLEPDALQKMIAFMDAHPETGMASCKLVLEDGSLDLACRRSFPSLWDGLCRAGGLSRLFPKSRFFSKYNLTYLDENETHEVEAVNGAFMFVRREALEDVGTLDEDYFMYVEDLDWCYRFRSSGWKVVYHPDAKALHFKGRSGNPRSAAMIRALFESAKLFYRKHYFPRMDLPKRMMILWGLWLWKRTTLARNALRREKRTRP